MFLGMNWFPYRWVGRPIPGPRKGTPSNRSGGAGLVAYAVRCPFRQRWRSSAVASSSVVKSCASGAAAGTSSFVCRPLLISFPAIEYKR